MDASKLLSILRTCIDSKLLLPGRLIHQKVVTLGLHDNIALCKNLINLYFSCQSYDSAKRVFRSIENHFDISLWNALLAAYCKNYMYIDALELFGSLLQHPYLKPDSFSYPSVLKACGGLTRVHYGTMLHAQLIRLGLADDVVVGSSLVGMYTKCNLYGRAILLFDEIPERDVACWNAIISCSYQGGKAEKALELYEKMKESGFQPNSVSLTTAIASCARLSDLERGKRIHEELVRNGFELDGYVNSALIDMYAKCSCIEMGKNVFEQMTTKTVVAWNSMIAGYSSIGDSQVCIELFRKMNAECTKPTLTTISSVLMACVRSAQLQHGKFMHGYIIRNKIEADTFVDSALIDLYFKCGRIQSAETLFERTPRTDVVCWNVMISGYVAVGNYLKALDTYDDMEVANLKPNAASFVGTLSACSQLAALEKGKEIHKCILEHGLDNDRAVMGALLDMYAKCGAMNEALNVFRKLPEKDLVSWTTMIDARGSHGHGLEALKLFREMQQQNVKPDKVSFLAVLSACSHAGLTDEGYNYFNEMTTKHCIKPVIEHYSCLIDLLGRAGRLDEAYKILKNTPEISKDVNLLSTLFSACHLHKNLELGQHIGRLLIKKDPHDISTYITLSKMYAYAKRWDEVGKMRLKMKKLGRRKNPGCSWIEVKKRIHSFLAEDKAHPETCRVYGCLKILSDHMELDDLVPS